MSYLKKGSLASVFFCSLFFIFSNALPINAASVLAAWLLSSDGVLKVRTAPKSDLQAFFQSGFGAMGDRVWIDFPGELIRPRKINGNGPFYRRISVDVPKFEKFSQKSV